MIRTSRATGKVWRIWVVWSLILSLLPLLVTPVVADEPEVPYFELHKTADPSPVFTSSPMAYTLTVTNIGRGPSQTLIITDVVPSGVTLTNIGQDGALDGDTLVWTLSDFLDVGASTFVTFTVQTANVAGKVINQSYGVTTTNALTPTYGVLLETAVLPGIVINEIMQNPAAVDDSDGEWFELYNPTDADVDINGWTIQDADTDSHVIDNGGPLLIPSLGYLVLGRNGDFAINGGVEVDYAYSHFVLANGDDEIILQDAAGHEIDRVEYDGGPNFPNPNGASMELKVPSLDNNVGANWQEATVVYGHGDLGTPGGPNGADTLPPLILETTPNDGAADVDVGVTIEAVFNEDMDETTVTADVFTLIPSVPGVFGYNDGTNTLTFDPDTDLTLNTTYTATIAGSVTDQVGNLMGDDYSWSFTTGEGVPLPAIVVNEIMQNPSRVSDSAGEWIELYNADAVTWDLSGWTIKDNDTDSHVIDDSQPLLVAPGEFLVLGNNADPTTNGGVEIDYVYSSFILGNKDDEIILQDAADHEIDRVEYDDGNTFPDPTGASMALSDPILDNNVGANWYEENAIQYGVGDYGTPGWENGTLPPDTEPPEVVSTDPENDEKKVGVKTKITATFNEAINEGTLNFTLTNPSGSVAGNVSYDPETYTATFAPDDVLDFETSYTAAIAAGLEDVAGNATTEAYTWTFSTGAPLLVSEIQVAGGTAGDEFIELYNPSPTKSFNLKGCFLAYRTATGGSDVIVVSWNTNTFVPPYGHYLLTQSDYDGPVAGDYSYDKNQVNLADDGGGIAIRYQSTNANVQDVKYIIDSVGYGAAANEYVEGEAAPAPPANQSIERRPGGDAGNMDDTDNNKADFQIIDPPFPQNTASPQTPAPGVMVIPIAEARAKPDGTEVTVEGIATAPSGIYYAGDDNTRFYIQDGTAGTQIQVFGSNGPLPQVTLGDLAVITGVTGHYLGEFQIVPQDNVNDITITEGDPENVPLPREVAIADVGEDTEGWLITLEGLVVDTWASGYGYNVRLTDGQSHETRVYVDNLTGIDTAGIVVGFVQRFVGISTQSDALYETKPRIQQDVPERPSQQGVCPAPAETAPGPLLISAVYYDTSYLGYDEPAEAVQVMNTGETAVSLAGVYLSDNEAQVALPDLWLNPGQKVWLARQEARFTLEFGFAPAWTYGDLAPGLLFDNDGDEALLLDASGAVVDAVVIEDGCAVEQSGWNDGAGVYPYLFASYVPADGQILYRKLDEATGRPLPDTDTVADWAQDPNDGALGRKLLYPGWDLDQFFFPSAATEDATTTLLVAPDNIYDGIARLITEAQTSIDLELYLFTHPALADELVAAMERGVHVRLLLDGQVYGAPDGTWDSARWVAKQVYDHPNGEAYFWRDGEDDQGLALPDRYNNAHQRFIVVDGVKAAILSESLGQTSMPDDDKSDGTAGNRGAGVITTAPDVVAHLRAVFAADLDPIHHRDVVPFTPGRDDVRHESGHEGEPLVRPAERGNRTGYTPVRPEPLTLSGVTAFEVVQSPETSLRTTDALLGLVARADGNDLVLVQQLYEQQNWGPEGARFPNPRLDAYIEAARRGATVRIMVANDDDDTYEDDLIQFLNDLAAAEGLDMAAGKGEPTAGWLDGEPEGGQINSKTVLVYDGDTQGWVHVGSINGSENASRYNREMALQIGSDAAFNYYAGVFHADWVASGLPAFLNAPAASFEVSDDTPVVAQTVFFTDTVTGSAPLFCEWDFGDGSPASAEAHPSHVYDTPGVYVVTLHAANAVGESFAAAQVHVGYPPAAAFSASPTMPLPGETVQFTGESSGTEPLTYLWDFGDGGGSGEVNPTHAYSAPGSYTVALTVSNPWGQDAATGEITVYRPFKQYFIGQMAIHWRKSGDVADFALHGQLKLPPFSSQGDLTREAILSIEIAGQTFWQRVSLAVRDRLWYLAKVGDGRGMNIKNVGILWKVEGDPSRGHLLAAGTLDVPGIGPDTKPKVATVTLKLLAKPNKLPFHGREQIKFKAHDSWWLYARRTDRLGGMAVEIAPLEPSVDRSSARTGVRLLGQTAGGSFNR
jgi:uncharacterized repeat protein (TIGR01451 family)